jgi:ketosteroid isomerase-like protein
MARVYTGTLVSAGFAGLSSVLDESATARFPGMPVVLGRDRVVVLHELLLGAFDDRRVYLRRVLKAGGAVVAEWTFTGTQTRDWMQVAPTHRPVAFEGVTLLWTGATGTITDVHVYFDVARVKAQLGAGPKELRGLPAIALPTGPPEALEREDSAREMGDVAVVRTELDALEARDEKSYLATMSEDVVLATAERAEPARGLAAIQGAYKNIVDSINELDTAVMNVWGVGAFVAAEYTITGMQRAAIGWVPLARDRVVTLHVVDVVELRDGRITRISRYDNPGEVDSPVP